MKQDINLPLNAEEIFRFREKIALCMLADETRAEHAVYGPH